MSASLTDSGVRNLTTLLREDIKDEFEIIRQIGRGGMAVVFLAREIHLDRHVAIKVLPPELTFGQGIERFKREAKTSASLDHPNIIPIHRVASGGLIFWYTMKFVEGKSLEQVLRETQSMALREVTHILRPVADALQYAHERQVIHRDIKPANVMVDTKGRVMVTDFGIARALGERTLTSSGVPVGTPHYMSPEQATGLPVSPASDQYSLGVMAYRMLCGQVPFDGTSAVDILHKQCTLPPPPLNVLRPSLPDHVYQAIDKSLAKNPGDRFSSVTAFVEALRRHTSELRGWESAFYSSFEGRYGTPGTPRLKSRRTVRRLLRRLAVGLGVAVLVVAAGFGAWQLVLGRNVADSEAGAGGDLSGRTAPTDTVADSLVQEATPMIANLALADLPDGAVVRVDGVVATGTELELEPGQHTISIEATGYETITDRLTLAAGERLRYPFRAREIRQQPTEPRPLAPPPEPEPGFLRISARPWANVLMNGRFVEQVTARLDTVAPGEYNLRFERPGFISVDTTVTVQSGQLTAILIRLTQGTP
ncbi:MAG: serine/threonine protein kinase [Gemmatimonadota bacterium]|nr:MAG: serine/threonine protein kinase [Gemmatimonadota bacterium]